MLIMSALPWLASMGLRDGRMQGLLCKQYGIHIAQAHHLHFFNCQSQTEHVTNHPIESLCHGLMGHLKAALRFFMLL